ncbi:DUF7093 family protein [Halobaculum lipolyticum]|uniref:Oxidoreductase n=1 Tax=Halobaculum lipolyticum TaxID=3032001 RepID=A0ABD5WD27_9EURY|nr:hypothetical protein [Halobaculum sp. DT31]
MGLRCLLGHDFTEPRTERDREERGDEVVVAITEVKECRRCGETRVVSENKEVTSLAGRADPDGQPTDGMSAAGAETGSDPAPSAPEPGATDADGESTTAGTAETAESAARGDAAGDDGFDHPTADPDDGAVADVGEDAEIIDAGADGDADGDGEAIETAASPDGDAASAVEGRGHGEWPDADANRKGADAEAAEEPAAWPDDDRPDAGDEATPPAGHSPAEGESEDVEFIGGDAPDPEDPAANEARTDVVPDADRADDAAATDGEDAEFVDGDGATAWPDQRGEDEGYDAEVGGDDGDVTVDGNLTPRVDPDAAAGEGEDVEFIEADPAAGRESPGASARNGSAPDSAGGDDAETGSTRPQVELTTTADRVETVYVCPDCGNSEPVGASSMRAGDICPDCKRGYIEERELR